MAWNRPAGNFIINRFPICAAWYYVVAKALGYSENEAKSLGIARATFFAAAKNGFKGAKGGKSHPKKHAGKKPNVFESEATNDEPQTDSVMFCGLNVYLDAETGLAVFGGETIKPSKFDEGVSQKFIRKANREAYDYLIEKMSEITEDYDGGALNSSYAYELYTSIRDEFREKEFFSAYV